MKAGDLPQDLLALEQELARRSRPEPPGHLRNRVLAAMQKEMLSHQPAISLEFVAGIAAILLLGINLAMSTAFDVGGFSRQTCDQECLTRIAAHMRGLDADQIERQINRPVLDQRDSSR